MIIEGRCHCGNLSFGFSTVHTPDTLVLRSCQCSFCRTHGAVTARDPEGSVAIHARDKTLMTLYRFGTRTTDFLLCSVCGAYVAAVMTHNEQRYATLNMRLTSLDVSHAAAVVYDDESRGTRIARRVRLFTPVTQCPF